MRTSLALLGLGLVIARYLATTYNKVKWVPVSSAATGAWSLLTIKPCSPVSCPKHQPRVSTILAFVSFTSSIFFLAFATYRYFTVIDESVVIVTPHDSPPPKPPPTPLL